MCEAGGRRDVGELQSKKDELLQEKLSLLRDYGVALTISREQLELEIQSLEAKKSAMEAEALASEGVTEQDIYEEDDWEGGDLPTGWDSLPWSDGVCRSQSHPLSFVLRVPCFCSFAASRDHPLHHRAHSERFSAPGNHAPARRVQEGGQEGGAERG